MTCKSCIRAGSKHTILYGDYIVLSPGQTLSTFHSITLYMFVKCNVESVWQPCIVMSSVVEGCPVKFDQGQNCRAEVLDICIV